MITNLAQELLGAWRLQSFIETNLDTGDRSSPLGDVPVGFALYTQDGFVSSQVSSGMPEIEKTGEFDDPDYMAFAGKFSVDERGRKLSHHILISPRRSWIGTTQDRIVTVTHDKLELSLFSPRFSRGSLWAASLTWVRPGTL